MSAHPAEPAPITVAEGGVGPEIGDSTLRIIMAGGAKLDVESCRFDHWRCRLRGQEAGQRVVCERVIAVPGRPVGTGLPCTRTEGLSSFVGQAGLFLGEGRRS